ncbi:MAG: PAS domain-containing protein [Kiritimatiellae bacterium]|nr:PAS domain-containing protein [Kiritimatiellia bacterium]
MDVSTLEQCGPETLERIREAFTLFDHQSGLLLSAFGKLKRDLAEANRQLNAKNLALSYKVDELQQVSSRLRCILESLADGVLVVDPDFIVQRCNPASERLLGLPRTEIEGRPYGRITNGLGNSDALRRALERGEVVCDEPRSCSAGAAGRRVTVLASVSPIRSPEGALLGAVEVLRDITVLRALETRVQHQERMAALGEMAASVAHEIRNPLGTIEGFARLLRRDLEGRPAYSRLADKIVEGTKNLNYVITNLLTYVRPMTLQYEPFDAATLLSSVRESLAGTARSRKVTLKVTPAAGPVRLEGDVRQLRQVLVNLGVNAIEACLPEGQVCIRCVKNPDRVKFSVQDDGCGISTKDLTRIFDPFFTRKEGGTGLGLSLSHKIIAAHGGRIDVQSRPGKGTTFELVLPLRGGKP